jgi:hypothetical protein
MRTAQPISLDQMDELLRRFRPIEHLFRVMGTVNGAECDGEILRSCSDIGLSLTSNFREHLELAFRCNEKVDCDKEGHQP